MGDEHKTDGPNVSLLKKLGFKEDGQSFTKNYSQFECSIIVDFEARKINWPDALKAHDQTTSNFSQDENYVVLECVDRLMEKGYSPSSIELEKKWSLGRQEKGKLDILVKRKDDNLSYLMIECKTFGKEFEREQQKMLEGGGQLFSYWQQDRTADLLCLYSSRFHNGKVEYENSIVFIDDTIRKASNATEAHNRWNKQFAPKGVFDDEANPYLVEFKPLKREDLKEMKDGDAKQIYKQFLEILRHNIVSDKGNAFNKIFNLFLCKILDEDRSDEYLEFQWVEGQDDEEILLGRLNSLYKKGMLKYLNKNITDYSEDDIETQEVTAEIKKIIKELRLYKNQEFAFLEVFNKETFKENARIVIEIVKVLQNWRIRYNQKQQFLGDFFELLLNTGFKQESGQFFTPVPLVRFILNGLPIGEIINKKIKDGEDEFLPYIIDYACGSGHFLTESMDIIQEKIKNIPTTKLKPAQNKKLKGFLVDEFGWAKEYIYGIEKDYRLAKTSKLASFLHGDGDAVILHASGIDAFSSESYSGRLSLKGKKRYNEAFDILVANPPYSVNGFKSTVENGEESFDIYEKLPDKSREIEVLFIERMCQLVKKGGVAGIVLPRSILSNLGIYEDARRMIFENFHLRGIATLGSNAFLATGINTVVLFLTKREKPIVLNNREDYLKMCKKERDIILINSLEGEDEKRFLGYEFSNRKGSEGISSRENPLLDKTDNYVRCAMLDEDIPLISEELKKHIKIVNLESLFNWEGEFANTIITDKLNLSFSAPDKLIPMNECISLLESGTRPKGGVASIADGIGSLGGAEVDGRSGKITEKKMNYVSKEYYENMKRGHVKIDDILVCKDGAQTGKVAHFNSKETRCINEHLFIVRSTESVNQRYMFHFMMSSFFHRQVKTLAYNKKGQAGLNQEHFKKIKFLNLPIKEQEAIVSQIDKKWDEFTDSLERIEMIDNVFKKQGLEFDE